MKYYDKQNDTYIAVNENKALSFLYNTIIGRIILKICISKHIANLYALYQNSRLSKHKIKKFIKKNNIDMNEYENKSYSSFNDFFMRKIKKNARVIQDGLISPCDSLLSCYEIDNGLCLHIKNSVYTVDELTLQKSDNYNGGYALVYRLCVDNYHRYIYPFNGKVLNTYKINGLLHTVQPIALKKYKVFSENSRVVTQVESPEYGLVTIIEVGAMMIGKVVNEDVSKFKRGDEKGHFEFGGSTIVYLFEKDKININHKYLDLTKKNIETKVMLGDNLE